MIKINSVKDDLQASLNDRQAEIPTGTVEEKWNAFKSIMYQVSKEKLGTAVGSMKDGSTEAVWNWKRYQQQKPSQD